MWSQNYATEILHCYEAERRQCNVMLSYWIRQRLHTHSMNEKTIGSKIKKKQKQEKEGDKKKNVVPPPQRMWQIL